jgi:hypothetical protein
VSVLKRYLQWWKPLRWPAAIVAAVAFLLVVICSYLFGWKWTGFPKQTFWDWLDLLIVPVVLAIGGYLFNSAQNRGTQKVAEPRAQDDALQAYLDKMSDMLIPNKDQPSLYKARPGDSLSEVARARTLTVLPRLDGDRKAQVVQFLYEAGLITKGNPILVLRGADLSDAKLNYFNLRSINLSGASLQGAYLFNTDLSGADLSGTDLLGANAWYVNLSSAQLVYARLSGASLLRANLSKTNLSYTYLGDISGFGKGTNIELSHANLQHANLSGAEGITVEELEQQAKSLEGAAMPNCGNKPYEEWLEDRVNWSKSKARGEAGENE